MTPTVRYNNRNERDKRVMSFHVKSLISAFSIGGIIFTIILVLGAMVCNGQSSASGKWRYLNDEPEILKCLTYRAIVFNANSKDSVSFNLINWVNGLCDLDEFNKLVCRISCDYNGQTCRYVEVTVFINGVAKEYTFDEFRKLVYYKRS